MREERGGSKHVGKKMCDATMKLTSLCHLLVSFIRISRSSKNTLFSMVTKLKDCYLKLIILKISASRVKIDMI